MTKEKEIDLMLTQLRQPFANEDIEWRIQSSGVKNNRAWAKVLAYVQARAIQERLDEVFGILGWQDHYQFIHFSTTDSKEHALMKDNKQVQDGVVCAIEVYDLVSDRWISKSDGAPFTNFESFKGGISDAFKRTAASGFGIGRYLYKLTFGFAEVSSDTKKYRYYAKIGDKAYSWNPPKLPEWALPGGTGKPPIESDKSKKSEDTEPIEIEEIDKNIILAIAGALNPAAEKKVNDYIKTGAITGTNISTFMHDTYNAAIKKKIDLSGMDKEYVKRLKDKYEIEVKYG